MVEGMRKIVVTVTGYCGSERMKLIKLINHSGANYVGKMSKSVTHLICWKFEGEKYRFAKSNKILIVNHQWIEDCIKEGKRVPESPYTRKSGREVGFNISNLPAALETGDLLSENSQLLNKPTIHDYLNGMMLHSAEIKYDEWDNDPLLDENLSPKPRSRETARQRSKKKLVKETSREASRAKAVVRRAIFQPQEPSVDEFQCEVSDYSPKCPIKQRRSNNDCSIKMGSDFAEPSHRNRRLVKKNAKRCDAEIVTIDDEELSRAHEDAINYNENIVASRMSNDSIDLSIDIETSISREVETAAAAPGEITEENNYMNDLDPLVDTCLYGDDALNAEERNMKELTPDEDSDKDRSTVHVSADLSCVICWTEFSSIRGILPCGHRFCFSCIQSWSEHMALSSKDSKCPLCKETFVKITKVDATASSDQKIYSQTIPCPSTAQDIFVVPEGRSYLTGFEVAPPSVCCNCQRRDPEEFLEYCQFCHSSCIHFYCLDPPLFPWTCFHCRERRLPFLN